MPKNKAPLIFAASSDRENCLQGIAYCNNSIANPYNEARITDKKIDLRKGILILKFLIKIYAVVP